MIVVQLGKDLVDELVLSSKSKLFEGSLQLLGINNSTEIAIEDIEGSLDVLNFLDGDGESGKVLSSKGFFFWGFGWLGCGLGWSWFSDHFAHNLKISKTN